MGEQEIPNSRDLLAYAERRGTLSVRSTEILSRPTVIAKIDEALEESYSVTNGAEVLLITIMPDDSYSMLTDGKQQAVIVGHNDLLDAMSNSAASRRALFQTRYLNGYVLNPFSPLNACLKLDTLNYPCPHGTPLYQETITTLGCVITKTEELIDSGAKSVRTATLIMTDGDSTEPEKAILADEVKSVVADMRQVGDHIVAGMGFTTSQYDTSFRDVFLGMGIAQDLIFNAASREEVLRAFRMFGTRALELTGSDSQSGKRTFEG